jgi:ribosomal-protein-alanine N-acetyltransferase
MHDDTPTLTTARLVLRIAAPAYAAHLLAYHRENRAHLARWSPPEAPDADTVEHHRARLIEHREDYVQGRSAQFVLLHRGHADSPIVGTCGLSQIVRGPFQACYLGYAIAASCEGQGLMSEAVEAVVRFGFESLKLHRIMANHVPDNHRSARLLSRLGFVSEGYAHAYLWVGGAWRDHVLTARTNPHPITL